MMQKFTFELEFQINGIGAASGLVYKNNSLYIIGDNSKFLYEYSIETTGLKRYPLLENPSENIIKKEKADFEAIASFENNFYIFGSGSTEKRNRLIEIDSDTKEIISNKDLTDLYLKMQNTAKIAPTDFNIEGAIMTSKNWYLFNRGNGKNKANAIFTISSNWESGSFEIFFNQFNLPEIKGVPTSFTDAILVDKNIYFLATAEDSDSTYNDGEVLGSLIGCIDLQTMKIEFTQQISNSKKLEGLTLYKKSPEQIEFFVCEDNDSEELKANVYKLTIPEI